MLIALTAIESVWTYEGTCATVVETAWPRDNAEMSALVTQKRDRRLRQVAVVA